MRVTSSRRPGRSVTVKATPRRNYIALLRLQVRIRLVQPASTTTTEKNSKNDVVHTTVIRRHHCLLISSNQKLRSLLLRFRDVQSCLEFVDRLLLLNPLPQEPKPETEDSPQQQQQQLANSATDNNNHIPNNTAAARQHGTVAENRQVLSFVGSLLHDEDFANMVDHLEASITGSEDGARMLEALVFGGGTISAEEGPNNNALPAENEHANEAPGEH